MRQSRMRASTHRGAPARSGDFRPLLILKLLCVLALSISVSCRDENPDLVTPKKTAAELRAEAKLLVEEKRMEASDSSACRRLQGRYDRIVWEIRKESAGPPILGYSPAAKIKPLRESQRQLRLEYEVTLSTVAWKLLTEEEKELVRQHYPEGVPPEPSVGE